MKDKRQRMAMAWPYAVYTDPAFAASILQAAAASAGGLAPIAAVAAAAYPYQMAPYYQPHPALARYTPYPMPPRAHHPPPYPEAVEGAGNYAQPTFCHSPTLSDNSVTTLSPSRIPNNSPENCDGSSSCRCGIINCVAGNPSIYAPTSTASSTAISLLMTAADSDHGLTPTAAPISDQPKKLFQPYKTDIAETV